jgi:hypothetical protein
MKKASFLLLLLFVLTSSLLAQQQKPAKTAEEIKTSFCHKWKLISMEATGKKSMPFPTKDRTLMIFNTDQTFVSKVTISGHESDDLAPWTYDHKSMTITIDDHGQILQYKITKITETDLVLGIEMDGMKTNLILKRLD